MSAPFVVWRLLLLVIIYAVMTSAVSAQDSTTPSQEPAASSPPLANKYVIRGCLTRSTLTDIEPPPPPLKLPAKLRVASTRTIRDQVKALSGHQVEVTGALVGVPGVQEGILLSDSGALRVYLGGADPNLGQDLVVNQNNQPMIRATTIKDIASVCADR